MTTVLLGRICRTCLRKSASMRKISGCFKDDLTIESMLNQVIPNYDMGMDDIPLPVEICKECVNKLQTSYDFMQMCLKNNQELRNILNQQEQEIEDALVEDSLVATTLNVIPMEIVEETDVLTDNFKKEPFHDECSNGSQGPAKIIHHVSPNLKIDDFKVEIDLPNESQYEGNSDSDEHWPDESKDDSDSNFFEQSTKGSLKPKRKYNRKEPLNRVSTKICLHCNKIFAKKDLLIQHLSVHDPENQFICDICCDRFSSERKLKIHLSRKHKGVERILTSDTYTCPDCAMIFQQPEDLDAHRNVHLQREFICRICKESFSLENQLNDHINRHMGYKKHKCDFCEKSFSNSTSLKDHVRIHTGESPFLCSHCGKSFKTANILRQHLQRHGEKKFHCPECPMKFYVKVNLTQHMTSHSKLKPHVCDICGSAFTRQDSLKAHRFKHSGERPFKCEDCNMSFVFKRHLNRHKITHTGEKPHMCTFCDRAYAASGDLVKHLRTHVGEKTYFCDQCPEAFKYSLDLKHHKNQHYKDRLNLEQKDVIEVEMPIENIKIHPEEETVITLEELYEVDKNSE